MATTNKKDEPIYVGIDNEVIELTGAEKEAYLNDKEILKQERDVMFAEIKARQEARINLIKKLAEIANLTDEEIATIL